MTSKASLRTELPIALLLLLVLFAGCYEKEPSVEVRDTYAASNSGYRTVPAFAAAEDKSSAEDKLIAALMREHCGDF